MKKILILGAGRSAFVLITKLIKNSQILNWQVDIADLNFENTKSLIGQTDFVKAIQLSNNEDYSFIVKYDIVVSMLPPQYHFEVAKKCLQFKKHLVTASYITNEIQALHKEAEEKKIIFLMECGLDPGIDHMGAMQMIDEIKYIGGSITSFKSYCGGLVTNESVKGNPWKYKITWNPKNVVLAGQGSFVKYLENNKTKYSNYTRLFQNPEIIHIDNDTYEGYPNRDSLQYISKYELNSLETFKRGTLRRDGFCKAWNALIQLGFTDDKNEIDNSSNLSYKDYFFSLLPINFSENWFEELNQIYPNLIDNQVKEKIEYLGLLSDDKISLSNFSPAFLLQYLLESRLKLDINDKDLVVMQHKIEFQTQNGMHQKKEASLIVEGEQYPNTAMSKTVGLPIFYALKVLLSSNIEEFGVRLPNKKWLYEPILSGLAKDGIKFNEHISNNQY